MGASRERVLGADDATTIELTTGVKVNDQHLPAGKYSIWAESHPEKWTIILNRSQAVWHTRCRAGQDALRIEVTPRGGSHMETLAFYSPSSPRGKVSSSCIGALP